MMGVYFAATGFGNKLAGSIGEASQLEKHKGEMVASVDEFNSVSAIDTFEYRMNGKDVKDIDYPMNLDMNVEFKTSVYLENDDLIINKFGEETSLKHLMKLDKESVKNLMAELKGFKASRDNAMHAKLLFEKDGEAVKNTDNKGDGKDYGVSFVMEETQSNQEYKIFMWIVIYTVAFGLLLMLFLKKLKKLTHGAEDKEGTVHEEAEGFELADKE